MDRKMNFRKNLVLLVTALVSVGSSVAMAEEVAAASHYDPYASLASVTTLDIVLISFILININQLTIY
jgi:hypothetical protein